MSSISDKHALFSPTSISFLLACHLNDVIAEITESLNRLLPQSEVWDTISSQTLAPEPYELEKDGSRFFLFDQSGQGIWLLYYGKAHFTHPHSFAMA